jgi:hypothetical protein
VLPIFNGFEYSVGKILENAEKKERVLHLSKLLRSIEEMGAIGRVQNF